MTNTVNRINDWLDGAAGENCALEEVAIESVQNEAQTSPMYTNYAQHNLLIAVPLKKQHWLNIWISISVIQLTKKWKMKHVGSSG